MSHAIYLFSRWALVFLYPARCLYALMTHAFYVLYSVYLATPKSRRVFLMLPCHATYMLIFCWGMYSLHLATPKSRLVVLMLPCQTLFIVLFFGPLAFGDAQE